MPLLSFSSNAARKQRTPFERGTEGVRALLY